MRFSNFTRNLYKQVFHNQPIVRKKMTWRSNGKDNADLVRQLEDHEIITQKMVKKVMAATDRKYYCPNGAPYQDSPQCIGYGVTISAPHMHAFALELLSDKLVPGANVLDVGSGSGYLTACFARAISKQDAGGKHDGIVVGIEHQPELVRVATSNINKDDPELIKSGLVMIIKGDGRLGYPEKSPYDAIHVGAASPETPHELIKQLKNGGRMICPVGPDGGDQYLEQFDKDSNGKIHKKRLMGVMYVPLTDLRRS